MKITRLLFSFIIAFAAGAIGSLATVEAIPTWYAELNKPFFNPPNSVFGPVWTLLYAFQAIALYLFWTAAGNKESKRKGFALFGIQVVLNTLWSLIFFGLKLPEIAFGEIIMLWVFILLTFFEFRKVNKVAGYLLLPYLAWVSFAAVLNLFIVLLN